MLFSVLNIQRVIVSLAGSRYTGTWKILRLLMVLFLFGYIGVIALILGDQADLVRLLTGLVFFAGALFVFLVVRVGRLTIAEDHEILKTARSESSRAAERQVREQKAIYEQILDNMALDLALFDADLRYEYVNPRAIKDPEMRAWLVGRDDRDYARRKGRDPGLAENRIKSMRRVFSEKIEIRFEEFIATPAGQTRHVLRVLTPIFNEAGEVFKIVGEGIDITEQKRIMIELEAARDQAQAANRAKSEFLANMSHEIRTPLNAILGMTELLSESPLNAEQENYLRIARKAGDHLLVLIDDILDLSRIESGRMELEVLYFSLAEVVERSTEAASLRAQGKGLSFQVNIEPDTPEILRGDPARLRQILVNLVSNAVKFTERGEVRVDVRSRPATAQTAALTFEVRDTGPGIPAAKQATIFDAFVQADSSTTRRFGGTGLGLAICRRLTALLGGELELRGAEGGGCIFLLRLNMRTGSPDDLPGETASPVKEAPVEQNRTPRILLVEDNEDNRFLIQAYLRQTPIELSVAENGREALKTFQARPFDLVLLDMQMPVMDGYETARAMRDYETASGMARTPIVALTAHALKTEEQKCFAAGCDRHMAKPIQKKQLLDLLTFILDGR